MRHGADRWLNRRSAQRDPMSSLSRTNPVSRRQTQSFLGESRGGGDSTNQQRSEAVAYGFLYVSDAQSPYLPPFSQGEATENRPNS